MSKSALQAELKANLIKEWRTEFRSSHGFFVSLIFGVAVAVAVNLATFGQRLTPPVSAALVLILLIFSALLTVPRSFLAEDEQGTFDLCRLVTRVDSAFTAKALLQLVLQWISGLVIVTLFVELIGQGIANRWLFLLVCAALIMCAVGSITLSAALVVGAKNKWVLACALTIPLLVPLIFLAHPLLWWTIDPTAVLGPERYAIGLSGMILVSWSLGHALVRQAWQRG